MHQLWQTWERQRQRQRQRQPAEAAGRGRERSSVSGSCEKLRVATPATIRAEARIACVFFSSSSSFFFFFLLFFLWPLRPHNVTQNVALSLSNFADHKSEPNTLAVTLCNTESSLVSRRHRYRHRHRHSSCSKNGNWQMHSTGGRSESMRHALCIQSWPK